MDHPQGVRVFCCNALCLLTSNPTLYSTDESRIAFVCSLLTGRALEWATAVWSDERAVFPLFTSFLQHFREIFEHPAGSKEVGEQLLALRQGRKYSSRLRTILPHTLCADPGGRIILSNSSSVKVSVRNFSRNWPAATRVNL